MTDWQKIEDWAIEGLKKYSTDKEKTAAISQAIVRLAQLEVDLEIQQSLNPSKTTEIIEILNDCKARICVLNTLAHKILNPQIIMPPYQQQMDELDDFEENF